MGLAGTVGDQDDKQTLQQLAAEVANKIADGVDGAEMQLAEMFQPPVMELLVARSGDRQLAEDLWQDTFLIIIQRLRSKGIDDPSKLPAFVCQTARNLLIAHRRKLARRNTVADTVVVELQTDTTTTAETQYAARQTAAVVAQLLEELSQERDRELLRRFYILDQAKKEICAALELSSEHFDRVLYRARQRFRSLLQEHGLEDLLNRGKAP